MRPFINTLNSNAVDKALAKTERYVQNGIISSEIYASKSVREDTTEKYFADLTQDAFSKDLLRFKEVIRTSVGEKYRYKALTESQFEELISITFERIVESPVVKAPDDLKRLIFANGIMAEKSRQRDVIIDLHLFIGIHGVLLILPWRRKKKENIKNRNGKRT